MSDQLQNSQETPQEKQSVPDEQLTRSRIHAMTTDRLFLTIYEQQNIHQTYLQEVAIRVRVLEFTEQQYKTLRGLVAAWIDLVKGVKMGEPVTSEWGRTRDALVAQAHPLIDDDLIEI